MKQWYEELFTNYAEQYEQECFTQALEERHTIAWA